MKILLIEDEPFMREAISSVIEHKGIDVAVASNLEEARMLLRSDSYHLILTDLLLPGPEGIMLVREIKSDPVLASTPVVAVTALEPLEYEKLSLPVDGWLHKPFTLQQLTAILSKYSRLIDA